MRVYTDSDDRLNMDTVASIASVATAAAQLSRELNGVARSFGNAGKELKGLAAEIGTLSRVLGNLRQLLRARSEATRQAEILADSVLSPCESVVEDGQKLLSTLVPLRALANGDAGKAVQKRQVRWLLERSKFSTLRENVVCLQRLANLLLAGGDFAVALESGEDDNTR